MHIEGVQSGTLPASQDPRYGKAVNSLAGHAIFFANDEGKLTTRSMAAGFRRLGMDHLTATIRALAFRVRFNDIAEGCFPFNDFIDPNKLYLSKHFASAEVWDKDGNFDEGQLQRVMSFVGSSGVFDDKDAERLTEANASRDMARLGKPGGPASEKEVLDGADVEGKEFDLLFDTADETINKVTGRSREVSREFVDTFFRAGPAIFEYMAASVNRTKAV